VVDKVDLHLATDLDEELITVGKELQSFLTNSESEQKSKIVLTTNESEKEDGFEKVKSAFMNERKAVIIKLKEQTKSTSRYESIGHLVIGCNAEIQKYLIFYTL
jgi:3-dehydroquinate synthetase